MQPKFFLSSAKLPFGTPDADRRADETERQMTDDERFALIISLSGATRFSGGVRDQRYPEDAPLTAAPAQIARVVHV